MPKLPRYEGLASLPQYIGGVSVITEIKNLNVLVDAYNRNPSQPRLNNIRNQLASIQLKYPELQKKLPIDLRVHLNVLKQETKPASMLPDSRPGTTLSPGQALLVLIRNNKENPEELEELRRLYLCGPQTENERQQLTQYFKSKELEKYNISGDPATINNDPTRRYFETHLAFETVKTQLNNIELQSLYEHGDQLFAGIDNAGLGDVIIPVLLGEAPDPLTYQTYKQLYDENLVKEYTHYIASIRNGDVFPELDNVNREKLRCVVAAAFMGVMNARLDQNNTLPLNIYETGYFAEANKGKRALPEQETARNMNLGLMKGHMPLPSDDIARAQTETPLLKPSDQAGFVRNSLWIEENFNQLVHPFSNSISGTMLCQLRVLAYQKINGTGEFSHSAKSMSDYLTVFTAAMLYGSGGHTFKEFLHPIQLPETRREFLDVPDYTEINLESMFYKNNETAFDAALNDTLTYADSLQKRASVHHEFKDRFKAIKNAGDQREQALEQEAPQQKL